jgi:hypothetical protein
MAAKRKRATPTVAVRLPQERYGGRVIDVSAKYPGKTAAEKLFGPPPTILAEHGEAKLIDHKGHLSHRLDAKTTRPLAQYEAFYQFSGGILGYITKKQGEPWKLSVTVSRHGQFPKNRPVDFSTWQAAWAYVTERL